MAKASNKRPSTANPGRRRTDVETPLLEPGASPAFFSTQVGTARRMYRDLKPARNQSLAVVCAGFEHCSPEFEIRRDRFQYYCIEYVLRGQGSLSLGDQLHDLKSGDVFAYTPQTPHLIKASARDPFLKYFVDFTGTRARQILADSNLSSGGVMRVFPPDSVAPLFEELIRSGQAGGPKADLLCTKLLECIALRIAAASTPSEAAKTRTFAVYQQCRSHIEEHCRRLKTLDQIAQECRIDKSYLCHLFRRFDHVSPYQSLLQFKMKVAADTIRASDILIKDVAAAVGFSDPLHFSRLFHRMLGMWPSDFRNLR